MHSLVTMPPEENRVMDLLGRTKEEVEFDTHAASWGQNTPPPGDAAGASS